MNEHLPLIEVRSVYKTYDKGLVPALHGISLSLERGKIYALMGPSGCGKSTLLNIIGTLDNPDKGEILYEGRTLKLLYPIEKFRQKFIGFIFQFHHLIPVLTLCENVEAALLTQKEVSSKQRRELSTTILEEMGLKMKIDSYASQISGGQRQRGAIARALINSPKVVLADEPTGNVDSKTAKLILQKFRDHIEKTRGTILMATHDHNVAAMADVIIEMQDGEIVSIVDNKLLDQGDL